MRVSSKERRDVDGQCRCKRSESLDVASKLVTEKAKQLCL